MLLHQVNNKEHWITPPCRLTYPGLIVVKLIILTAVEHAVYLQDIGIGIRAGELVPSAIKAEDELLLWP